MMFKRMLVLGLLTLSAVAVSGGNASGGSLGNADGTFGFNCPAFPVCTLDGTFDINGFIKADEWFLGSAAVTAGELGCVGPNLQNVAEGVGGVTAFTVQDFPLGDVLTNPETRVTEITGVSIPVAAPEWAAFCGNQANENHSLFSSCPAGCPNNCPAEVVPGNLALQNFWSVGQVEGSTATCKPNPDNEQWIEFVVFPTDWVLTGQILFACKESNGIEGIQPLQECKDKRPLSVTCTTNEELRFLIDDITDVVSVLYDCS